MKRLAEKCIGRVHLHWLFGLIVLIAVMPVFVLYYERLQTNRERALEDAGNQVYQLATRAAEVYSDITIKSQHVLETIAVGSTLPRNEQNCADFFKWVQHLVVGQGTTPWITGLFLTDQSGKYICGTFNNGAEVTLGDREYFRQMLADRSFTTSGILIGKMSQRLIIGAALPIYDRNGKFEVAVTLGADLYQVNEIASEANTRFGGRLLILDEHGEVLANLPNGNSNGQEFDAPALIRQIVNSNEPTLEIANQDGVRSIYGIRSLPRGQKVAIALSRDAVLDPIERAFRTDLLFLLLVAAGSVAASLIVAEFAVLRGVRILKTAALRLKAGKMGLRVQQPRLVAAELDDLAATYNAMTAEFERLAYLDRLTGLPNRRYLERQLNSRQAEDDKPKRQAVLAIDLDSFKPVNDTYGHAMGDRVLTAAARRIAMIVDERGLLTRLGGDEFVALIPLPDTDCREYARKIGEEIRDAMDKPLDVDGVLFDIGCSVGLAIVPDDATSLAGAIVVADAALYEAKRAGRNRVIENAPALATETTSDDADDDGRWIAASA